MPRPAASAQSTAPARRGAQRHLFGAAGSLADAIVRIEQEQRQRARAEALRMSGSFYVDRLVGSIRAR